MGGGEIRDLPRYQSGPEYSTKDQFNMDRSQEFFKCPVLNSPYEIPSRHWELDDSGQPTEKIIEERRKVSFITPIPRPRQRTAQRNLAVDEPTRQIDGQEYELEDAINNVRGAVDRWRSNRNLLKSRVTPETEHLLDHWHHHKFSHYRPFFCQLEAVETVIWLTEVAPSDKTGKQFLDHIRGVNEQANPGLERLALKLATGAGKTTVMAMLIAWQTINAVRHPSSHRFTRGFLVVTPGITIKDRLRVLQPNDPDSYYQSRELVPGDMLNDLNRAQIVITNYHAFKLRDTMNLSKGGRAFLQGRGPDLCSTETEGQMLQRVMPKLMGMRNVLILNDEAHHCYREKPDVERDQLRGDSREEAKKNREAARLWVSGLEAVTRTLNKGMPENRPASVGPRAIDLSATPFFLSGSGYAEGTLFPWTVSDFSLMDAIECGIVKLPRVPVADNIADGDMPKYRNLWEHIGADMPKKRRQRIDQDPRHLPVMLQTALDAIYGDYKKTFDFWCDAGIDVPPCFIVICNNTSTSKLIYDYIAGFHKKQQDGSQTLVNGHLDLFRNFDDHGVPLGRPRTLLIDSEQIESGDALDPSFHKIAVDEIERFRRDRIRRTGDIRDGDNIADQDLLREVLNTVGKKGQLGETIRCVVSVSMLTEGWDANTVTHVLGVRAFGTQLLCEQAVGRALRRQSYELNDEGMLPVEYADVFGIPFDFTAKPVVAPPQPPRKTVHVKAITPERDACEIRFPRVAGYRVDLPEDFLHATFSEDSTLELTPDLVGPTKIRNEGIIGEGVDLRLVDTGGLRRTTLLYHLTKRLLETKWHDSNEEPKVYLFGQLKRITRHWLDHHLVCRGGTSMAQLMYPSLADMACERITQGIVAQNVGARPVKAVLDPYNPVGSTTNVNFTTSKKTLWKTASDQSHVNWVVCDSSWEAEFCRVAEAHSKVRSYIKNHGLDFKVPYRYGAKTRIYIPDFIVLVDDGRGPDDLLHLVVEIKGYRGEDAKAKKATMDTYWVPGVNALEKFGRWSFTEFTEVYEKARPSRLMRGREAPAKAEIRPAVGMT